MPCLTPDRRYLVVRGRLWRATNPGLTADVREACVHRLMDARRAVKKAMRCNDGDALARARAAVQEAKVALGERGPVWWTDGAPDFNRHMVINTPYAAWYASAAEREPRVGSRGYSIYHTPGQSPLSVSWRVPRQLG